MEVSIALDYTQCAHKLRCFGSRKGQAVIIADTTQTTQKRNSSMTGTFINVATILIGGALGLLFGSRIPEKLKTTIVAGMGLFTLAMGLQMFLKSGNQLIVLGALIIGALIGEWLGLEDRLQSLGQI